MSAGLGARGRIAKYGNAGEDAVTVSLCMALRDRDKQIDALRAEVDALEKKLDPAVAVATAAAARAITVCRQHLVPGDLVLIAGDITPPASYDEIALTLVAAHPGVSVLFGPAGTTVEKITREMLEYALAVMDGKVQ